LLERLTPPIPEIAAEYWIIVHRDLRRAACVRAAIDWVMTLFAEHRDVLAGVAWGGTCRRMPFHAPFTLRSTSSRQPERS
jgi:hypothetical protein